MSNKKTAKDFLNLAASGKVDEAYDKYVASHFFHHNPFFKGDRQSLKVAMNESSQTEPNKSFTVKKCIEEGDIVVTYSHLKRKSDDPDIAVVHIFRFEDGQISELWDLGQEVPKDSPNKNGMF